MNENINFCSKIRKNAIFFITKIPKDLIFDTMLLNFNAKNATCVK